MLPATGAPAGPGAVVEDVKPEVPVEHRLLGDVLISSGRATREAVEEALAVQEASDEDPRPRLGALLVARGILSERELAVALADQLGLRYVDLRQEVPDTDVARLLDEETARDLQAVPMQRDGNAVVVAVADPTTPELAELLTASMGSTVRLGVGAPEEVGRALDRTYRALSDISEFVDAFEARAASTAPTDTLLQRVDENAPVVQVVSRILSQAVRDRASDVHIEPMGVHVRVRNRIDGALHEVLTLPSSMGQALSSRIKIMADLNIVERRRPQDGQLEMTVDGRLLDVRVATAGTVFGEKVVLRILDRQRALYDLSELGMPEEVGKSYRELIRTPHGMVVCAGPTGSGKTTTLYATLSAIQSEEINVMTVEDPVEYVFPEVNQISINEQAGITFAGGLRSILRHDPDTILVGEIRDSETARIATQAALTGHLVLTTVHATDAASALHRFLDMGIESFLLASSMVGIVGQRLVRRVCSECREEVALTTEERAFYERAGGTSEGPFHRGAGCTYCSGTGYFGRVGVYEVLTITEGIRELMISVASSEEIRTQARADGMVPMRHQAIQMVDAGTTTVAEVMRTVYVV